MFEQTILILILALNFVLIWISVFGKKIPWYRSLGVIIWIVLLIYLPISSQVRFEDLWFRFLGLILLVIGLIIFLVAKKEFKTKEVRSNHHLTTSLVTTGLYGKMRHPQYFGLMLFYVGWSLVLGAWYAIYLIPAVVVLHVLQSWLEERFILEEMFGKEYKKYQKEVGMFWKI